MTPSSLATTSPHYLISLSHGNSISDATVGAHLTINEARRGRALFAAPPRKIFRFRCATRNVTPRAFRTPRCIMINARQADHLRICFVPALSLMSNLSHREVHFVMVSVRDTRSGRPGIFIQPSENARAHSLSLSPSQIALFESPVSFYTRISYAQRVHVKRIAHPPRHFRPN